MVNNEKFFINENSILYHGSRGGIVGKIKPISRSRCDFGKGFYMGTNCEQAKSLVSNDQQPMIYRLRFSLQQIPSDKILRLNGMPWAFTVLLNRGRLEKYRDTTLYRNLVNRIKDKDVLIGPIADDNMGRVMKQFISGEITDKVFLECIQAIDYGIQYVAKTQEACDIIEIISERELNIEEIDAMQCLSEAKRKEGKEIVDVMKRRYRREGQFWDEILDNLDKNKSIEESIEEGCSL